MKKILLFIILFAKAINLHAQDELVYPAASIDTAKDYYFGKAVDDHYRWLENDTLQQTKQWVEEELELSARYLDKLKIKYRPEKQLRLNSYAHFGSITKSGRYFFDFILDNGPENQSSLYIKKKINDEPRKIIDPDDYKSGKKDKVTISDFEVSNDNRYIAFSLSHSGSDWNEIHVMSLYPFHSLDDLVTGVKFSDIVWGNDGFFYKKYHTEGNILKDVADNPCVWYHKISTQQTQDSLVFSDPLHPKAKINISNKINRANTNSRLIQKTSFVRVLLFSNLSLARKEQSLDRTIFAIDLRDRQNQKKG